MFSDYTWEFVTIDTIAPQVITIIPANSADKIKVDATISAQFSEEMDSASVNENTFTVTGSKSPVTSISGIVTYNNKIATFIPESPLEPNATYIVTISNEAKDLAGNKMFSDYTWEFGTIDTIAPQVITVIPANSADKIKVDATISVQFSEEMDSASVNETSFKAEKAEGLRLKVEGEVKYNNKIATFIPASLLEPNIAYTATVTRFVKDSTGNKMLNNYIWSFNTIDTKSPEIISVFPNSGANDVSVDTSIEIKFSEEMDSESINESTFYINKVTSIQSPVTSVEGKVTYNNRIVTFTPTNKLESNILYSATVTRAVKDLSGNAMGNEYIWSFSIDNIPPIIISTNPGQGANDVDRNTTINVLFSEAMDSSSINSRTFYLSGGVSGNIKYKDRLATFTPYLNLSSNLNYTATITQGVRDISRNNIAENYIWDFTTRSIPVWLIINAGINHNMGIKSDGTLWAWGLNSYGVLGLGGSTNTNKNAPTQVGADNNWIAITCGAFHNMGVKSNGTLWAWGLNSSGQLGDSTWQDKYQPIQIGKDNDWIAIRSSGSHIIGLKKDGTLWTWGRNSDGQLGNGTKENKNFPAQIGE